MVKRFAMLGICFAFVVALILATQPRTLADSTTPTPLPTDPGLTCAAIVSRALAVMQSACSTLDRNKACYGNDMIQAELTSTDFSFQHPGDIAPIQIIKTITTSPFN